MNILITSASRKVGLIEAFKKALSKEGGGKVIAVDFNPLSPALFRSDISFVVPESSDRNFINILNELCRKYKVKLIIPTRDEELILFSKNKELFDEIGAKVMVAEKEVIEICSDKLKFLLFCKKNNIPIPKIYNLEELRKTKVKFPVFARYRFGKSSKGVFIIENKEQLSIFLKNHSSFIFQELIKDKEYTIDLFSDFNGRVISIVPRERIYVFGGETFIGKTYKNFFLIKETIKLTEKLNLIGHNTIQCFYNSKKKKIKFIEINPRFGGGVNLSIFAGADTPLYIIRLIKGKTLKSRIGKFKDNLIMLRYAKDIFVNQGDIKRLKKI